MTWQSVPVGAKFDGRVTLFRVACDSPTSKQRMDPKTDIRAELQALKQKWEVIAETRPTPRSTTHVIEYGLGK